MDQAVLDLLASNRNHAGRFDEQFEPLLQAQRPEVVTVCCGDSRVLQEGMWDSPAPGHLFTHSNIGNRVTNTTDEGRTVSGDVLYPLVHTGTTVALVVGHTGCGAITAAYADLTDGIEEVPGIQYCVELLEDDIIDGLELLPGGLEDEQAINHLVEYNVDRQVEALCESPDVPDAVTVVGLVYDFQDVYDGERGEVHVISVDTERDPETLRELHPEIADRVRRVWTY